MRNYVAKHDHNRASVHTDQKKAWGPDVEEGLDEHFEDIQEEEDELDPRKISISEYERAVKASGIVY